MNPSDGHFPEFSLPWEMSAAERFVLVGLLQRLKPAVAIEIGTHHGGSLQVLAAFCGRVHSIDLDPGVRENLAAGFPAVRFHTGQSRELIPHVLAEVARDGGGLGFVLVDGDHTAAGVQADLEALLRHVPDGPVTMLLHDSFNPDCRAGMRRVDWAACPQVHRVELDFVPGGFHARATPTVFARSMWGGFGLVELRPEPRSGPLAIGEAQRELHELTFRRSAHRLWHKVQRRLRRGLE